MLPLAYTTVSAPKTISSALIFPLLFSDSNTDVAFMSDNFFTSSTGSFSSISSSASEGMIIVSNHAVSSSSFLLGDFDARIIFFII